MNKRKETMELQYVDGRATLVSMARTTDYKVGDRVAGRVAGYGPDGGKAQQGVIEYVSETTSSYGDYIKVRWDSGKTDEGSAKNFRDLRHA